MTTNGKPKKHSPNRSPASNNNMAADEEIKMPKMLFRSYQRRRGSNATTPLPIQETRTTALRTQREMVSPKSHKSQDRFKASSPPKTVVSSQHLSPTIKFSDFNGARTPAAGERRLIVRRKPTVITSTT